MYDVEQAPAGHARQLSLPKQLKFALSHARVTVDG
jgi:hypothetical protein